MASKGFKLNLVAAFCMIGTANAAGAVEITHENHASLTKGKNHFVKFLAPW